MKRALALGLVLFVFSGCGAAAPTWPPPLPSDVAVEPDEPRRLAPVSVAPVDDGDAEPPAGPESHVRDGDLVEVVEGEHLGIRYLEMIFGEASSTDPLPTIWIFHGRGDRARVPGGPFWGLPRPVRIFVPQGPVGLGDGYAWFLPRAADPRTRELADALRDSATQLAAMIAAFERARPTLGRPIVTGFSQGGHLSLAIALLHSERVSHAFPSAGFLPPELVPDLGAVERFPPIRAQHPRGDPTVPLGPSRALMTRLRDAGLDVELVVVEEPLHRMTPEMDARLRAWLVEALEGLGPPVTDTEGDATSGDALLDPDTDRVP